MSIFGLVFVGIAAVFIASLLKEIRPEYAVLAVLAGGSIILFSVIYDIGEISDFLSGIFSSGGVGEENTALIFKALGIGYLTQFASELCADCGSHGLSSKVELAGRLTIIGLCLPVVSSFLETVGGLLGPG